MNHAFYQSEEYKRKQSSIAHHNWLQGRYLSLNKPLLSRTCKNPSCSTLFFIKPFNPKLYCSQSCAAKFNNVGRTQSIQTKQKISLFMKYNNPSKNRGGGVNSKVYFVELKCQNNLCKCPFLVLPYLAKKQKYCSRTCAIKVIGRQTTSPKASKGKSGVRPDIDRNICFYSTWEANIARIFNLVGLKWQYAPKIFDIGKHTYRPDFYLSDHDTYIEVKNFMSPYSAERDRLFRQLYPQLKLELISKTEYLDIKREYKYLVEKWE